MEFELLFNTWITYVLRSCSRNVKVEGSGDQGEPQNSQIT